MICSYLIEEEQFTVAEALDAWASVWRGVDSMCFINGSDHMYVGPPTGHQARALQR